MRNPNFLPLVVCFAALLGRPQSIAAPADTYPSLQVGTNVYHNATVLSVTATDLYLKHDRGFGSVKLRDLEPTLQQKYGFDSGKAAQVEADRKAGLSNFVQSQDEVRARAAASAKASEANAATKAAADRSTLKAKSVINQEGPSIVVERWLGEQPDVTGKFVLVDFWATWCGPCRRSIPHLNALAAKYGQQLTVIGLSDEASEVVAAMSDPKIEYFSGVDTQRRTGRELEVSAIPHAILMDPQGIVRFEGHPTGLTEAELERILAGR